MLECSAGSIISVLVLLHVVTVSVDRTYNTHPNRKAGFWAKEVLLDLLGTKRWWPSDLLATRRHRRVRSLHAGKHQQKGSEYQFRELNEWQMDPRDTAPSVARRHCMRTLDTLQ